MKQLFPYQRAGADFLLAGGSLLADEPGLGKTLQALTFIRGSGGKFPSLVTCPSGVTGVWEYEMLGLDPEARVLNLTADSVDEVSEGWDLIVTSMDLPARNKRVFEALQSIRISAYVGDEAHRTNNPTTLRTQTCLTGSRALIARAERRVVMTGTPTPMHAGQLWALIFATEPGRLAGLSYDKFLERYCRFKMMRVAGGRRQIRVPAGNNSAAVTELKTRLSAGNPWWLRRRKADVLPDLPKWLPPRKVMLGARDLRAYRSFLDSAEGRLLARTIEQGAGAAVGDMLRQLDLMPKGSMARLRRLIGLAKADAAADYVAHVLEDEVGPGGGVVVWAWHPAVLSVIQGRVPEPSCRIDGSYSQASRTDAWTRFQRPDGPRLFLGQLQAASEGITLTKADRVVFVERSFNPAMNRQACDRIDRIGQTAQGLQEDRLLLADSLDVIIEAINDQRLHEWGQLEEGMLTEGESE